MYFLGCDVTLQQGVLRQRVTRLFKILVQVFKNAGTHLLKQVYAISRITSAQLMPLDITVIEITPNLLTSDQCKKV